MSILWQEVPCLRIWSDLTFIIFATLIHLHTFEIGVWVVSCSWQLCSHTFESAYCWKPPLLSSEAWCFSIQNTWKSILHWRNLQSWEDRNYWNRLEQQGETTFRICSSHISWKSAYCLPFRLLCNRLKWKQLTHKEQLTFVQVVLQAVFVNEQIQLFLSMNKSRLWDDFSDEITSVGKASSVDRATAATSFTCNFFALLIAA